MHALGRNNTQVTLGYLFVVISENVIEKNVGLKYSVLHLLEHPDVNIFSD
jgi:hypothetical protein